MKNFMNRIPRSWKELLGVIRRKLECRYRAKNDVTSIMKDLEIMHMVSFEELTHAVRSRE